MPSIRDFVRYAPVTSRPPIRWPGGKRLAVWIVPNIEFYEYTPPPAIGRETWDRVLAVNLTAPALICQQAIPHLKASKAGRIINVASVMAEGTDLGLAAYCASKAGVAGLTRTLALELGRFGITANYLLPGAIRTGMTTPLWDARPDIADIWAKKSPLRRLGEPLDLARGALFLASDDGGFVTGHGLHVDGGLMLRV